MRLKKNNSMLIIFISMVSILGLFLFNIVFADNECQYHLQHTAECGYVEAVEGHECTHEHNEECYERVLTCDIENHEHTLDCYQQVENCTHEHNNECGYVEAVEGHECTHLCSNCDKELLLTGKIEIKDDCVLHIESEILGNKSEDQVYFYVQLSEKLLDKIDLEKNDGKYFVDIEDDKKLVLEIVYMSNDDANAYLKYEQDYGSKIKFDIPLNVNKNTINTKVFLNTASSFDETKQQELDNVLFNNYETVTATVTSYSINSVSEGEESSTVDAGIDFEKYIDSIKLSRYENGKFVEVTDGNINDGDRISLRINFSLDENVVTADSKTIYYQLPDQIRPSEEMKGYVYDGSTKTGTYVISEDGLITITFYDEYANGEAISGYIAFQGNANLSDDESESERVIIGDTEFNINAIPEQKIYDIDVNKSVTLSSDNKTLNYTVTVSSINGTESSVKIEDTLTGGAIYTKDSFVLKDSNGNEITLNDSNFTISDDGTSFVINNLPQLGQGEAYTLTYSAEVDNSKAQSDGQQTIINSADASSGNNLDSSSTDTEVSSQKIFKTGNSSRGDGKISWTINVYNVSGNYTIEDNLPEGLDWNGVATITPSIGGSDQITFTQNSDGTYSYTIPETVTTTGDYTITFNTTVENNGEFNTNKTYTNVADLITPDGDEYSNDSTVTYYTENAVDKTLDSIVSDDNNGAVIKWDVDLIIPNPDITTSYHYVDTLSGTSHHLSSDFLDNLIIAGADGTEINNENNDYYTITYYDINGNVVTDLSLGTVVKFDIDFNVEKLHDLGISKINMTYLTYAEYTMEPGQSSTYSNRGHVDAIINGKDNDYNDWWSGEHTHTRAPALDKKYEGQTNVSSIGAYYKWSTTINTPSTNNLNTFIYTDMLNSTFTTVNHYIPDTETFLNNFTIVDENETVYDKDSGLYTVIFLNDQEIEASEDDVIVGYKIIFNTEKLKNLETIPSQFIVNYQTYALYDMLPGETVGYSNTGSVTINDKTYDDTDSHSYKKDDALTKNYLSVSDQNYAGGIYYWKSILTLPYLDSSTNYYYTDTLKTSDGSYSHYILNDSFNLILKDENDKILDSKYYTVEYYDENGNVIEDITDTKIYKFKILFNCSEMSKDDADETNDFTIPNKLYLTYQTVADYTMMPGETVTYVNDARIDLDDRYYEDDASISYKKDNAISKSFSAESETDDNGAYYSWNTSLTYPNVDNLTTYQYIDMLSSNSNSNDHYIIKEKFNLKITGKNLDNQNVTISSDYYDLYYLDKNGNVISDNDDTTLIVGFKIIFHDASETEKLDELDLAKIYISYQTYALYDMNGGETVNYINEADIEINDEVFESDASHPHTKNNGLQKFSGTFNGQLTTELYAYPAYQGKRKLFFPTFSTDEKTFDITNIDGKLYYMLLIEPDDSEGDIVIEDKLPDGTSLITEGDYAPFVIYYTNQWNNHAYSIYLDGEEKYINDYFDYSYDDNSNIATFTLTDTARRLAKNSRQQYLAIIYALEVDELPYGVEINKELSNTASWNDNTDKQTDILHQDGFIIEKTGEQVFNKELGVNENKIHYSLIINPSGEDLLEGTDNDKIKLIDQVGDVSAFDYVTFSPETLKIYVYDPITQSDVGLMDSSLYRYTYDSSTLTLTIELPDNIPCRVEYDYILSTTAEGVISIKNSARIEGVENGEDESDVKFDYYESEAGSSKMRFNVHKVDETNFATTLSGAEFDLYKYDATINEWVIVKENLITDDKGLIIFTTDSDNMNKIDALIEENVFYKLVETKAPTNYVNSIVDCSTYFAIGEKEKLTSNNGALNSTVLQNTNIDMSRIEILNSMGDDLYISNTYSAKSVKKYWVNNDGTTYTGSKPNIQLLLKRSETETAVVDDDYYTVNIYTTETAVTSGNHDDENIVFELYGSYKVKYGTEFKIFSNYGENINNHNLLTLDYQKVTFTINYPNCYTLSNAEKNKTYNLRFSNSWGFNTAGNGYISSVEYTEPGQSEVYTTTNITLATITMSDTNSSIVYADGVTPIDYEFIDNWEIKWSNLPETDSIGTIKYTYSIEEIDVPDGWASSKSGTLEETGKVDIINTKEKDVVTLPDVGGMGIIPYTLLGITMISLVITILLRRKLISRRVGDS